MKKKNTYIYISGTLKCARYYEKAEKWLELQGYAAINPYKIKSSLPGEISPSILFRIFDELFDECDGIYVLDNDEKYPDIERAKRCKKMVLHSIGSCEIPNYDTVSDYIEGLSFKDETGVYTSGLNLMPTYAVSELVRRLKEGEIF